MHGEPSFTNFEVQNVNKAFVYTTDCAPFLRPDDHNRHSSYCGEWIGEIL